MSEFISPPPEKLKPKIEPSTHFDARYFEAARLRDVLLQLLGRKDAVRSNYSVIGGYTEFTDNEKYFASAIDSLKKYVSNPREKKVIDIGCAYGTFTKRLVPLFGAENVCGADISAFALEKAKEVFKKAGIEDPNLRLMDLGRTPFKDESFDVVTALDVVEHLEGGIGIGIGEIGRILKNEGIAVIRVPIKQPILWGLLGEKWQIGDWDKSHVGVPTVEELRKTLGDNSFDILEMHSYEGEEVQSDSKTGKLPKNLEIVVKRQIRLPISNPLDQNPGNSPQISNIT